MTKSRQRKINEKKRRRKSRIEKSKRNSKPIRSSRIRKASEGIWSFLDSRRSRGYRSNIGITNPHEMINYWSTLDREYFLSPENPEVSDLIISRSKKIEEILRSHNFLQGDFYQAFATKQEYGSLLEGPFNEEFLTFCRNAISFATDELEILEDIPINWTPLKKKSDYTGDDNLRGFVGTGFYFLYRIHLRDRRSDRDCFVIDISNPLYNEGGFCYLRESHSIDSPDFHIFIPYSEDALVTIYSEYLPIITSIHYKNQDPVLKEAITEGLAYHLANKFCDEYQVPNGKQFVELTNQGMMRAGSTGATPIETGIQPYEAVPNAINWIGKNGLREAWELYLGNPDEFMGRINKK